MARADSRRRFCSEVRHRLQLFAEDRASLVQSRLRESKEPATVPRFQRVSLSAPLVGADEHEAKETALACRGILEAIALRRRYHVPCKAPPYYGPFDPAAYHSAQEREEHEHRQMWGKKYRGKAAAIYQVSMPGEPSPLVRAVTAGDLRNYAIETERGVTRAYRAGVLLCNDLPTPEDYMRDLTTLERICHDAATKSLCFRRLELLDARFHLHRILNSRKEADEQRSVPHRDFYNIRKVDGHIHHSAVMTQKHLLRFMKRKLKRSPDEIVIERNGQFLTLKQVFDSLRLTAYDISIDHLDMHAGNDTFHRFDRFNLKYNPVGETRLREAFLKTNNLISGRFLAEITKEVFSDLEDNKYVLVEPRLSVYGKAREEWSELGAWFANNKLASPNVRWMVQIPRLYSVYRESGLVDSFQDLLDNIFAPIFHATMQPEDDPALTCFLNALVGLDCVDDESRLEAAISPLSWPPPSEWTSTVDPPYTYWIYYLFANLRELNALRSRVGMTTLSLRPHAGETGELSHLAATFLCAESINHGIMLRKSPSLQYLYYLEQIGLAVSPLSNNRLFLDYHSNPFPVFFARGLNVALSTDDPLLLHVTKEPLVEEYSVAAQVWKFSPADLAEIARNSVLMSGLEHPIKQHFIGEDYHLPGVQGNDMESTNVPNVRVQYRFEALQEEKAFVRNAARAALY